MIRFYFIIETLTPRDPNDDPLSSPSFSTKLFLNFTFYSSSYGGLVYLCDLYNHPCVTTNKHVKKVKLGNINSPISFTSLGSSKSKDSERSECGNLRDTTKMS